MHPSKMRVDELRKELRRRGASTTGNKAALVQRYQEVVDAGIDLAASVALSGSPAAAAARLPAAAARSPAVAAQSPAAAARSLAATVRSPESVSPSLAARAPSPSARAPEPVAAVAPPQAAATTSPPVAAAAASPAPLPAVGADAGTIGGVLEEEPLEEDHVDAAEFAEKRPVGDAAGTQSGVAPSAAESVRSAPLQAAATAAPAAAVTPGAATIVGDTGKGKDDKVRFALPVEGGGKSTNGLQRSDLHAQGSAKTPQSGDSLAVGVEKKATTPADRAVRFGISVADKGAAPAATMSGSGTSGAGLPAIVMDAAEEEKRRKRARKFELGEKSAKELQAEEAAIAAATRAKRAKAEPPSSPRPAVGATGEVGGTPASSAAKANAAAAASSGKGSARKLAPPVPLDEVELAKRALRAKRFACK